MRGRAGGRPERDNPTLLSADKTIAIADVSWKSANYDQKLFDGVYDHLSKLRSDTLQVEFTGDPFQGHDQQDSGVPPALLGFLAALVILAIVFRTVGATALPLASAAAALTARTWPHRNAQPRHERLEHHTASYRADGASASASTTRCSSLPDTGATCAAG